MLNAFLAGLLAASSLAIGALISAHRKLSTRTIGIVMAFGVGALISSVSFELIDDAMDYSQDLVIVVAGTLTGSIIYFFSDLLADKINAKRDKRKNHLSVQSGISILVGTVLDGIPESMAVGLGLAQGGTVSLAMIVAVFISNIPEALSSSSSFLRGGWKKHTVFGLWVVVIAISGLASLAGYAIFGDASGKMRAFILAFAGGAILTMLANSMMPTAYRDTGRLAGIATVIGFAVAFSISVFE